MCASLFYVVISRLAAEHIIKNTLGAVLVEGEAGIQHFLGAADHELSLVLGVDDLIILVLVLQLDLVAGFTFEEDSPEGIFDDVFSSESADDDE